MFRRILTRGAGRWGLLITSLSLGLLLIGFGYEAWRQAGSITSSIALGQADQMLAELGKLTRSLRRPPDDVVLSQLLATYESQGLRYVAFISPDGKVEGEAGASSIVLDPDALRGDQPVLRWIDDRARIIRNPPHRGPRRNGPGRDGPGPDGPGRDGPGRDGPGRDGPGRDGPGRDGPGRDGPGRDGAGAGADVPERDGLIEAPDGPEADRPRRAGSGPDGPGRDRPRPGDPGPQEGERKPIIVLELLPLIALDTQARAFTMLVIGVAAALAMMLSAVFFWRQSLQAERMARSIEAQRRLAALGEMSAVLAHEIKNPLAALKGNAQLLEEGLEVGSRERRKAERVVRDARRLERLVLQLLDFVRSGRVDRQPVDLLSMARDAAEEVEPTRIDLHCDERVGEVALDRDRMSQVLTNLLRNALQASPPEARVELDVAAEPAALCIEVRDRGDGIPPGEEDAIFEPFRTHRTQGVGLGLAVARRIVELHGGRIQAANRDGGGAVFRIHLPRQ